MCNVYFVFVFSVYYSGFKSLFSRLPIFLLSSMVFMVFFLRILNPDGFSSFSFRIEGDEL